MSQTEVLEFLEGKGWIDGADIKKAFDVGQSSMSNKLRKLIKHNFVVCKTKSCPKQPYKKFFYKIK